MVILFGHPNQSTVYTDWLSSFMSINIDVLFSIIRVVGVWCGILVSEIGFIINGGMFDCLMAEIQNTTV